MFASQSSCVHVNTCSRRLHAPSLSFRPELSGFNDVAASLTLLHVCLVLVVVVVVLCLFFLSIPPLPSPPHPPLQSSPSSLCQHLPPFLHLQSPTHSLYLRFHCSVLLWQDMLSRCQGNNENCQAATNEQVREAQEEKKEREEVMGGRGRDMNMKYCRRADC